MAGDKWEYWVELRPKSKEIEASLFNLKTKSRTVTAKEPTLRLKAFSKSEATALRTQVEKGGAVKAKVVKELGPEYSVTALQRAAGNLKVEQESEENKTGMSREEINNLRDNIAKTLPTSGAVMPKVPHVVIQVEAEDDDEVEGGA